MTSRRARYVGIGRNEVKDADMRSEWRERAVCQRAPEEDRQALTSTPRTREIALDLNARYCRQCPVRTQCFNWAYDEAYFTGMAGGAVFGDKTHGPRKIERIGGSA